VRVAERARIVLFAACGQQDKEIAAVMAITPKKGFPMAQAFSRAGGGGVGERRAPAWPQAQDRSRLTKRVVTMSTRQQPINATHWSTRTMAAAVGISEASVRRIWRAHGLKPHRVATFKISNDPQFAEKLEDVVGLYLNPPEHALVLCVDEKSQIQALDRTQPGLPLKRGRGASMTHDYKRNGTATLFAALNAANGEVFGLCQERHRHQEWLKFLRLIDQTIPADRQLHLICDNYATHKHPKVQRWLARHPRFHLHFTPTSASWLNMVERFFRDISENRIRRDSFTSVPELELAIDLYVEHHNANPKPFIRTKSATDILAKVTRAKAALALTKR
jgi:transposase